MFLYKGGYFKTMAELLDYIDAGYRYDYESGEYVRMTVAEYHAASNTDTDK